MTEHIPYSHKELIDLFSDCITKRRFIDKTVNGIKINTWGGVNNEEGFNLYNFYRPRNFFTEPAKCMERPDIILFYQSGISAIVEIKISRNDFLADFKKKHRKNNNGMGDYKYLLCSKNIDIKELPDTWGILRIDNIGKHKPYLQMERMAHKTNKNSYEEIELLSKLLRYGQKNYNK